MKTLNLLAYDLGASNGRGMLGRFDGKKITLEELCRFENNYVDIHNTLYWDILGLFNGMKQAFQAAKKQGLKLDCIGIDTWAVDYGLLDKAGRLLGNPMCYRNFAPEDAAAVQAIVPARTLFERSGIASLDFNTVYQLYRRKAENDPTLDIADKLLMIPDLLGYFLTGEAGTEYTNATTTMLYNAAKGDWDRDTIAELGLPGHIFTGVEMAGSLRGKLLQGIAEEYGINRAAFAAVGTHDTASAVAAIPGKGSFAFCSSGTWSLFGVETDRMITSDDVFTANFSNEGTVQGGFRPLKNIMGLWIIQECRREWLKDGDISWDEVVQRAGNSRPLRSIIDPDHQEFFAAGNMPEKVRDYCKRTRQPVPDSIGEIARCVYESLALKYRWAIEWLERIKGERIEQLNIVGGGIQNIMLNQMTANAIDRPVFTGPVEGACIGNALMQAVALGELGGIDDVRQVVRASVEVDEYDSQKLQEWDDAYGKLLSLMES